MSIILRRQVTQLCSHPHICRFQSTETKCRSESISRHNVRVDRMLRVNHAGEMGATRIYAGQLAVLGGSGIEIQLLEMKSHEDAHLKKFEELLREYNVRPTVLIPVWKLAGFVLGAGTAFMGKEGAMACTVAVETAVGQHYQNQIDILQRDSGGNSRHKHLIEVFTKFRDEEMEHLQTGLKNNAEQAAMYSSMKKLIEIGCKGAIWLSERI